MKDMVLLGKSYSFPEIKDSRFEGLQTEIRDMRDRIQEGSEERRILGIFRKPPTMDAGERIRLMEELVSRYDDMIAALKEKIGACKATFTEVGRASRSTSSASSEISKVWNGRGRTWSPKPRRRANPP